MGQQGSDKVHQGVRMFGAPWVRGGRHRQTWHEGQTLFVKGNLMARPSKRLVVCLDNSGYELALEQRKIYVALPDAKAERLGHIRVIDESGEEYLFPKSCFAPVDLPLPLRRAIMQAA